MKNRYLLKLIIILFTLTLLISSCTESKSEFINWEELKNPIYKHENWSTKDACMTYKDGTFYLFFSAFYEDEGRIRSHVVGVKTTDFKTFSEPLFNWRGEEGGWIGMCSPNLTKVGDTYYLTYNSWGDKEGQPNQLFYATSKDLEKWEKHKPLAKNLTEGVRGIDAALTYHDGKFYLAWKRYQTPQISWADTIVSEEWHNLGDPGLEWFENGEFINIDGDWHLLATAHSGGERHMPHIARMNGTGDNIEDWTDWSEFRKFEIPEEEFNTDNRANAAFLADWREHDGFYYLLYAGRTQHETHAGRGDNKLGLARSRDLNRWVVPPEKW